MAKRKLDLYVNHEPDAIDSYFECITECSLDSGATECITRCIEVHLKSEE